MSWKHSWGDIVDRWHAQPAWRKVTVAVAWIAIVGGLAFMLYSAFAE